MNYTINMASLIIFFRHFTKHKLSSGPSQNLGIKNKLSGGLNSPLPSQCKFSQTLQK